MINSNIYQNHQNIRFCQITAAALRYVRAAILHGGTGANHRLREIAQIQLIQYNNTRIGDNPI